MNERDVQVLRVLLSHLSQKIWILGVLLAFWDKLDQELLEAPLDLGFQTLVNLHSVTQLLVGQIICRLRHILLIDIQIATCRAARAAEITTLSSAPPLGGWTVALRTGTWTWRRKRKASSAWRSAKFTVPGLHGSLSGSTLLSGHRGMRRVINKLRIIGIQGAVLPIVIHHVLTHEILTFLFLGIGSCIVVSEEIFIFHLLLSQDLLLIRMLCVVALL